MLPGLDLGAGTDEFPVRSGPILKNGLTHIRGLRGDLNARNVILKASCRGAWHLQQDLRSTMTWPAAGAAKGAHGDDG